LIRASRPQKCHKEFLIFEVRDRARRPGCGDQSRGPEQYRTVKWSRRQRTAQSSGLRKFPDRNCPGQTAPNNKQIQTRLRARRGKIAEQITEKVSSLRGSLIEVRHSVATVKNGRNQKCGHGDTDPEHEIVMSQAQPPGWFNPRCRRGGKYDSQQKDRNQQSRGEGKGDHPPSRRAILHRAGDSLP